MFDGGDCLASPPALSISRAGMTHRQQVSKTRNLPSNIDPISTEGTIFLFRDMLLFEKYKLDW